MIVLWTAVLIFVATLGFFGYSIYSSQYNISWPPSISDCPDYWTVSSDGLTCNFGTSPNNYNRCKSDSTPASFNISAYPNLCDKFDFGKTCNASFNWSGVSNSLKCKK